MLTPSLAQQVAEENASVTGLGILITDGDGTVIGSSDPRRIGSFHEASVEVVRSQEAASHTARQAAALRGVRPGMTLPIIVDGQAVGTVGITGSPTGVRRLGPLVRRHTEMLLRESAALRTQLQREKGIEDLVRDISTFDPDLIDTAALAARAAELGFSLDLPRLAVLFGVSIDPADPPPPETPSVLRVEVVRTIREHFPDTQDLVATSTPGRVLLLHRVVRPGAESRRATDVTAACEAVIASLDKRHHVKLRAAIGASGTTPPELKTAIADAVDAFSLTGKLAPGSTATASIAHLRTYQVLGMLPQRGRRRLVDAELGVLRAQPDWPVLRQTLIAWCESGFKLVDAARRLHVHRNTLIYRLGRLQSLTGRDMRDYPTVTASYLACLADSLGEG